MLESYEETNNVIIVSTKDQYWDDESLNELRHKYGIYFMTNGDDCKPVMNKGQFIYIGVEDDGTIVFDKNNCFHVQWIPSLISNLQEVYNSITLSKEALKHSTK